MQKEKLDTLNMLILLASSIRLLVDGAVNDSDLDEVDIVMMLRCLAADYEEEHEKKRKNLKTLDDFIDRIDKNFKKYA